MTMAWPIVSVSIETEGDVVTTRQRARRIAELLGFDRQDQTRIATAVSEIARNAFGYANGGRAEFLLEPAATPQLFVVRVVDKGAGIADLQSVLDGRYRSQHGMGLGILGARRLMEHFAINSGSGRGTTVELGQRLPAAAARVTQSGLSEIVSCLKREASIDPLTALREQNHELMQSLADVQDATMRRVSSIASLATPIVAWSPSMPNSTSAREQLRQASELKSRFLSYMSHEFRTPLNSILALSRLLLDRVDGELAPEQDRQIGYIRRSAEGLLELVNDLLDLSKVEAGKIDVKVAPFTVASLFGALRGALRPLLTSPSVELIFDAAEDLPELGDRRGQGGANPAQPDLERVEVHRAGRSPRHGALPFRTHDRDILGAGYRDRITPENHDRIFEEFSQIDTELHQRVKGTGLGLPLSRSLAQLIGGAIRLKASSAKAPSSH